MTRQVINMHASCAPQGDLGLNSVDAKTSHDADNTTCRAGDVNSGDGERAGTASDVSTGRCEVGFLAVGTYLGLLLWLLSHFVSLCALECWVMRRCRSEKEAETGRFTLRRGRPCSSRVRAMLEFEYTQHSCPTSLPSNGWDVFALWSSQCLPFCGHELRIKPSPYGRAQCH